MLLNAVRRFRRSTVGAGMTEYIIVLGVVAIAAITAYQKFGVTLYSKSRTFADNVATLTPTQGGSSYCFVAGTLVETPSGLRSIEQIAKGDLVISRDEETGMLVTKHVIQTFVTPEMPLVEVGLRGTFEPIRATLGHPFFTLDRGWVMAQNLQPEEPLMDERGEPIYVQRVQRLTTTATVYNFEVEDSHTYFVGSARVWVHNPTDCNGNTIDPNGYSNSRPTLSPLDTNLSPGGGGGNDGINSPAPAPGDEPPTSPGITLTPPTPTSPDTPPDSPVVPPTPPNSPVSPPNSPDSPPNSPVSPPNSSDSPPNSPVATAGPSSNPGNEAPNADPSTSGPSSTEVATQESPAYQMNQVFQSELGQAPWSSKIGTAWKVANGGASLGLGIAGHFVGLGPIVGPVKAAVTAPISGAIAVNQYNNMYNQVTPQLEALQDALNHVPPDVAHDPERAAIAYTMDKMSRMLHNQYQNAQASGSAEGIAVNVITGELGHGSGFIKTAQGASGKLHGIKKTWNSESGTDSTAAAYILADQAFLNGSPTAQQSLEALYGKEYTQQLGQEWQKIHGVEQGIDQKYNGSPPLVSGAGKIWRAENDLTQKWGNVNIQQTSQGDPSGVIKIPPTYGVPGHAMINNDVLTRPWEPRPGRDQVRPVEDYQNGVIKDEFGKQYVPPRNKFTKTVNTVIGKLPGVSKTQTPTQQLAGHIANGIAGKPQTMQQHGTRSGQP